MKICTIMFTGCLMILMLAACEDEPDLPDDPVDDEYIDHHDENDYHIDGYQSALANILGEALGKPPGTEITKQELATLTRLDIPFTTVGHHRVPLGYSSMEPLAYCVNLEMLDLAVNQIADISPLAGLTKLRVLNLSGNGTVDISPLAGLTNLTNLDLSHNYISDLSPLAGLTQLARLDLSENKISDIRPLVGLVNLRWLDLPENQIGNIRPLTELVNLERLDLQHNFISDITPLSRMIHLEKLYLNDNQIVDLKPLVDNPGLVNENPVDFDLRGDVVHVHNNQLSAVSRNEYVPVLKERGVIVWQ